MAEKFAIDPQDPNLLDHIKNHYLDANIAGETANAQLLFLVCASAFTRNPLSTIVKGPSGAGKSHLVNRVLDVFRRMGAVVEYSRITPAFLENMANKNHPPKPQRQGEIDDTYEERVLEWKNAPRSIDLRGKILFIDELRGIQSAQSPKLLISEGRLRLGTVINNEPVEIEVHGRPVIITTTTLAVLDDPEFENRVIPIQIDESEDQTKRVLEFEAIHYEDPAEDLTEYSRTKTLLEFFQSLKPYGVANPYARKLAEDYPKKNIEARRDYPKLMNLCNVVTWLFQYQRPQAVKGLDIVVVANIADIERVKDLALAPLRESLAGLSEKEGKILQVLKDNLRDGLYQPLSIKDIYTLTRRQIRRGQEWTRTHVKRLVEEGYVEELDATGKQWKKEYCYSELQPETLEIKTGEYSTRVLSEWSQEHGYKLAATPVLDLETTQGQTKPVPFEASKPEPFPKSEFGKDTLSTGEFGLGQAGNGALSNSKTGMRVDPVLLRDFVVRSVIPSEEEHRSYARTEIIGYRVTQRFGSSAQTLVLEVLGSLEQEGILTQVKPDCWKIVKG